MEKLYGEFVRCIINPFLPTVFLLWASLLTPDFCSFYLWAACGTPVTLLFFPGDFKSLESSHTLPALLTGPFERLERFRNLKFAAKRITNIQSTVLRSSKGTVAIHRAFK